MATAPVLIPVQQRSLARTVADQLREAITVGGLGPGQPLRELDLSAQLGVSRAPIREALQALEREGLVTSGANKRCYVWSPTEADVDEILSMRVAIEVLAAEWALPSLSDSDYATLEDLLDTHRKLIAENQFLPLVHEDKRFHEYIVRRARHGRLLNSWTEIMSQWEVMIYRRLAHDPEKVMTTVEPDHEAILRALRGGDLRDIANLHRRINARVGEQMKRALRQPMIAGG